MKTPYGVEYTVTENNKRNAVSFLMPDGMGMVIFASKNEPVESIQNQVDFMCGHLIREVDLKTNKFIRYIPVKEK